MGGLLARYRLRFQLQEIDLAPGDTLLGRSPDCHVTVEDPLVSRVHACIRIEGDAATIEDLGSRNGLRINGVLLRSRAALKDGDRVRIGTQEFVFHMVDVEATRPTAKSTGFLRYCSACNFPYPEEVAICPNCGHEDKKEPEENTLSGDLDNDRPNWTVQLLIELLERALALGRWEEAEQVLRRACAALDERLASGARLDVKQFEQLASGASRVAQALQGREWTRWLVAAYARLEQIPRADVVSRLRTIPLREGDSIVNDVETIVRHAQARTSTLSSEELEGMAALEVWRKQLRQRG